MKVSAAALEVLSISLTSKSGSVYGSNSEHTILLLNQMGIVDRNILEGKTYASQAVRHYVATRVLFAKLFRNKVLGICVWPVVIPKLKEKHTCKMFFTKT